MLKILVFFSVDFIHHSTKIDQSGRKCRYFRRTAPAETKICRFLAYLRPPPSGILHFYTEKSIIWEYKIIDRPKHAEMFYLP